MLAPDELRQRLMAMVAATKERNMSGEAPQEPIVPGAVDVNYTGFNAPLDIQPLVPQGAVGNFTTPDAHDSHGSGQNYKLLMALAKASGIAHTNMGTIAHRNIAGTNTPSQHSLGNAFDIGGKRSDLIKMVAFLKRYSPYLRELIYSPTGTYLGRGGRTFNPRQRTVQDHYNHIHVSALNAAALRAILAKLGRR